MPSLFSGVVVVLVEELILLEIELDVELELLTGLLELLTELTGWLMDGAGFEDTLLEELAGGFPPEQAVSTIAAMTAADAAPETIRNPAFFNRIMISPFRSEPFRRSRFWASPLRFHCTPPHKIFVKHFRHLFLNFSILLEIFM